VGPLEESVDIFNLNEHVASGLRLGVARVGYRENLPAKNCPPAESHEGECGEAWRLLPAKKPTAADFASNAAKGEPLPRPDADPCRWASCSLFTNMDALIRSRNTFKKLRKMAFAAQVKIVTGSGRLLVENDHIDFWMFDTFDPLAAVLDVREL
jgi:hypothetical protein